MKNHKSLIRRLKKQVSTLHRKEKAAARKLKQAFQKIKAMGGTYERKAATNLKKMKAQITTAQAKAYIKAAVEVERQVKQKLVSKQKILGRTLSRFEKQFGSKLAKVLHQKAKRLKKGKKRVAVSSKKRASSPGK